MRLIDADELIKGLDNLCDATCPYPKTQRSAMCGTCPLALAFDVVENAPIVDAVSEKEVPMRVLWSGWKGIRDTRYRCQRCNKPVKNDDIYCHRCGQKLLFPEISFTPYIEGQKQEVIVRWSNETN